MDELWSFAESKLHKVWIWLAIDRDTRQIAGVAFGNRSDKTCLKLWRSLPPDYRKRAVIYSDFQESYKNILPSKRLRQVSKKSGETAHIERFNNTLRQRCPLWSEKRFLSVKMKRRTKNVYEYLSIIIILNCQFKKNAAFFILL